MFGLGLWEEAMAGGTNLGLGLILLTLTNQPQVCQVYSTDYNRSPSRR